MPCRLVSLVGILALLVALAGAIVVACYEVPRPDCGFLCGPGGDCPDGYACASDGHCHRNGSSPSLVCTATDARLPVDAAPDMMLDVPEMIDAPIGAGDDAGSATGESN